MVVRRLVSALCLSFLVVHSAQAQTDESSTHICTIPQLINPEEQVADELKVKLANQGYKLVSLQLRRAEFFAERGRLQRHNFLPLNISTNPLEIASASVGLISNELTNECSIFINFAVSLTAQSPEGRLENSKFRWPVDIVGQYAPIK
jgi:hypothetical protein